MKLQAYLTFLLLIVLLFFISCEEKKPEKASVKKQYFTEKPEPNSKEETSPKFAESTDENIITVSETQFDEYNMKIGVATMQQVNKSINAIGYIEVPKENKAEIRSYMGGYLHSSPLLPGDFIEKGQFLISLRNIEYIQLQQDYLKAIEELNYLKEVFNRKKVLAEENIISVNSRQQAESEYKIAMANAEGLRKKLQMINIDAGKLSAENITSTIHLYAPISGYITTANAVQGKFVEPTDVIFEITNTDHLHLKLKVYEKDILKIRKGDKINFKISEADAESYSGEVFLVGKTIEEEDRTNTCRWPETRAHSGLVRDS